MTHSTSMSNSATLTANGIEVTELPDIEVSASDGVFGAVLSAYRHEGFEAGRAQALQEVLSALVPLTEEFLRRHPYAAPELRKFVYSFGESLEKHLMWISSSNGFVEGGLGI